MPLGNAAIMSNARKRKRKRKTGGAPAALG
jgi:hypothetical protein